MSPRYQSFIAVIATALPLAALAHPGHGGQSLADGFVHPFLGADHLLAMLLVGVWSVLQTRRVWLAPALFVSMLAVGAWLGKSGLATASFGPVLELLLASSVLMLGLMLALPGRLAPSFCLVLIAGFATLHGMAHGAELSSEPPVLLGMVLGSAVLHGFGMVLARTVLYSRPHWAVRLGQASAVAGGGLLLLVLA